MSERPYKVHNGPWLVATCMYAEDAATIASHYEGARIKVAGRVVWVEGKEDTSAGESVDDVVATIHDRCNQHRREAFEKVYGRTEER